MIGLFEKEPQMLTWQQIREIALQRELWPKPHVFSKVERAADFW